MKVGYASQNLTIGCTSSKTFRLASYSEKRLRETIDQNLSCLKKILEFNVSNDLLFFRISSDIIPFGSHQINKYPWHEKFKKEFEALGKFIRIHRMRISMHPDQFVVLNTPNKFALLSSLRELSYHERIMELLGLDYSHKLQIHLGGAYGDKEKSLETFIRRYLLLSSNIKNRLVIENDDRIYSVEDCLMVSSEIGVPVIFDNLHHQLNGKGNIGKVFKLVKKTWTKKDGIPMVDYSSQGKLKRTGAHAESIDLDDFEKFVNQITDADIIIELKDKNISAKKAADFLKYVGKLS